MSPWIIAARPKTLIASVAPVLIGGCLAARIQKIDAKLFLLTMFGALLLQILTNYANDYFDFIKGTDTEDRIGPTRVMQAQLVTKRQMLFAMVFLTALLGIICSYLIVKGGPFLLFITAVSILLAFAYTAGPYPLAYRGLGDVFVIGFFGVIATMTTYYLQIGSFSFSTFICGITTGLMANTLLIINNLRDYDEDKNADKKTLVVRFGMAFGKFELLLSYALTAVLVLYSAVLVQKFTVCASLIPILSMIKPSMEIFNTSSSEKMGALLPQAAKKFTTYTLFFSIGLLL